jgi:very-short-patch-repair endonuclease
MKGTTIATISKARRLRRELTDVERRLWSELRGDALGVSFRRQHPIGPYVLDFFCERHGLAVEVDGGQHAQRTEADAARSAWLAEHGVIVVRFWNNEVRENLDGVIEAIRTALKARETVHWRRPSRLWRAPPT